MAELVNNPPAMLETWVQSLGWEGPWRRQRLPATVFWPREFHGLYGLQYPGLENGMGLQRVRHD